MPFPKDERTSGIIGNYKVGEDYTEPTDLLDDEAPEKEIIECQTCFWTGTHYDLEAPRSNMEPCCPGCLGNDFLEIEED